MISTRPSDSAPMVDAGNINSKNERIMKPQVVLDYNEGRLGAGWPNVPLLGGQSPFWGDSPPFYWFVPPDFCPPGGTVNVPLLDIFDFQQYIRISLIIASFELLISVQKTEYVSTIA